jgi:hypothetical protein
MFIGIQVEINSLIATIGLFYTEENKKAALVFKVSDDVKGH